MGNTAARRTDTPQVRHLASIAGVRFPALLLVFLSHLHIGLPLLSPEAAKTYYTWAGWPSQTGLSLFFLISGFVLVWTARENDTALRFWRRRILRIVPLHWVTFGISLAVFAYPVVTGKAAVLNLFMLSSWSSDPNVFGAMNAPSWSLTCLAFFYLAFPVLHRAARGIQARHLWWCAAGTVAAIFAVTVFVRAVVEPDPRVNPMGPASSIDAFYYIQIFPGSRVLEFFLGILLARIVLTGRWPSAVRPLPTTLLLIASAFAAWQLPKEYRLVAAMIVPLALFAGSLAASDAAGRRSVLGGRFAQWLGDISFAFFLIHWPVIVLTSKVVGQEHLYSNSEFALASAVCLVVSVVLAWLLTVCVEKPLVRLLSGPRTEERTETEPRVPVSVR